MDVVRVRSKSGRQGSRQEIDRSLTAMRCEIAQSPDQLDARDEETFPAGGRG
jgi:hypothetical protein